MVVELERDPALFPDGNVVEVPVLLPLYHLPTQIRC